MINKLKYAYTDGFIKKKFWRTLNLDLTAVREAVEVLSNAYAMRNRRRTQYIN